MSKKQTIAIIGGGASALLFACTINTQKYNVTIYEKNKHLARKFLVAGDGGFNLTHSENIELIKSRYTPAGFLDEALTHFTNIDLINWLNEISIPTYIGTSKRVFPEKGIKPIEVLENSLNAIKNNNVEIKTGYEWTGFIGNELQFINEGLAETINPDITVFCLGGASWKKTGSAGNWKQLFEAITITVNDFYPSNCAYKVNWNMAILNKIAGKPIKNASLTCANKNIKGEVVLTEFGIEGSGIYPLSPEIRKQLIENKKAIIYVDFKPDVELNDLVSKFISNSHLSVKDILLKIINLTETHFALLKSITTKEEYQNLNLLASLIKRYPIEITDFSPIDDAISTVGGIGLNEINNHFELVKRKNTYCIGEMLNYDAPTGGYLLQSCFSMGKYLAYYLNKK